MILELITTTGFLDIFEGLTGQSNGEILQSEY